MVGQRRKSSASALLVVGLLLIFVSQTAHASIDDFMIKRKSMNAITIANDSPYGLAGYIQSLDIDRAHRVSRQLRAGGIYLNGNGQDYGSPFGGYKQSGNGREWGEFGLHDFLEIKVINGFYAA